MKTTILLADDHPVLRKGLKSLLEEEKDFCIVGEAANGQEALDQVRKLSPDIVVMDITMPGMDGIQATRLVTAESPGTRVIALSIHGGKRFVENMLKAGASGYILKDTAPEELVDAIRAVSAGKTFLSAEVIGLVVSQYVELLSNVKASEGAPQLVGKEQKVLQLMAEGNSNPEISQVLQVSEETLDSIQSRIMDKLGLPNRTELTEYAGISKWFLGSGSIDDALGMMMASKKTGITRPPGEQALIEPLTNREIDTLELLARRIYNKEIADQLSISVETVKTHIKHIYQKLGVGTRREAVQKAKKIGLIPVE